MRNDNFLFYVISATSYITLVTTVTTWFVFISQSANYSQVPQPSKGKGKGKSTDSHQPLIDVRAMPATPTTPTSALAAVSNLYNVVIQEIDTDNDFDQVIDVIDDVELTSS